MFEKFKKMKNKKYIVLDQPIISEPRKKFINDIIRVCKNIISKYDGFFLNDINDNKWCKDFYTAYVYFEGSKPQFGEDNNIEIIYSD